MINMRLFSLIDARVLFIGKLVMLGILLLTLMAARGEIATAELSSTASDAAAAASHDILVLAAVGLVPAVITGAITVLVLLINRRSDAKAKAAEVKATADAKLAEGVQAALVKAAERDERRAEKEEERARAAAQAAEVRAVAVQAARAAEMAASTTAQAAAKADEVASVLKETNAAQAETARATAAKLEELNTGQKVVHAIVNSQRTEDIEAKLVLAESNMILLREVATLKEKLGEPISDDTKKGIAVAVATIKELRTTLDVKKEADKKASAIIESDKAVAEAVIVAGPAPVLVTDERTAKGVEKIADALAESRKPEGR